MKFFLLPISILYGLIIFFRNKLFDWHILTSKEYATPIISIGNLSVGGTGKTPHTEFLVRLLKDNNKIAVLSRGYGRKTKGYILADRNSTASEIGDEPKQFKNKFESIKVAVCEKRRTGIEKLKENFNNLDVFLLDDAYQHRYVKAGFSVLLTDFHKLYSKDYLLPVGRLREFRCGAKRADVIIVTKTPYTSSPILKRNIIEEINPRANQKVFFSHIKYDCLKPVPGCTTEEIKDKYNTILLFSGIANSYPLEGELRKMCYSLKVINFPDHHEYSEKDFMKIYKSFHNIVSKNKIIVTTEKDMMRFINENYFNLIKELQVFYMPIMVDFDKSDKNDYKNMILNYVEENKGNS